MKYHSYNIIIAGDFNCNLKEEKKWKKFFSKKNDNELYLCIPEND